MSTFECDAEKLLGGIDSLPSIDQKILYVVVLLRIYEIGGPCRDPIESLAYRCKINKRRATEALDYLFRVGKLYHDGTGIMNKRAGSVLHNDATVREARRRAGAEGAKALWQKVKQNQQTPNGTAMILPGQNDGKDSLIEVVKDSDSRGRKKERGESESHELVLVGGEIGPASGWPRDSWHQFYQRYPHKVAKRAAERAFRNAQGRCPSLAVMIEGLDLYIATKPPDQAWCNPATWLNGDRWKDKPAIIQGNTNGNRMAVPQSAKDASRNDMADFFKRTIHEQRSDRRSPDAPVRGDVPGTVSLRFADRSGGVPAVDRGNHGELPREGSEGARQPGHRNGVAEVGP